VQRRGEGDMLDAGVGNFLHARALLWTRGSQQALDTERYARRRRLRRQVADLFQ